MSAVLPLYLFVDRGMRGDSGDGDPHAVVLFNERMRQSNNSAILRLDTNRAAYGGSKNMPTHSYVGCFGGFREDHMLEILRELPWDEGDGVQALMQDEEAFGFTLHEIQKGEP